MDYLSQYMAYSVLTGLEPQVLRCRVSLVDIIFLLMPYYQ